MEKQTGLVCFKSSHDFGSFLMSLKIPALEIDAISSDTGSGLLALSALDLPLLPDLFLVKTIIFLSLTSRAPWPLSPQLPLG